MSGHRLVTMKYIAQLAGVKFNVVRRCVRTLHSLVGNYDLFSVPDGSLVSNNASSDWEGD